KDNKIYVANSGDGFVTVIDATTNTIVHKFDNLGAALEQPQYDSADGLIYMTSSDQNAVFVFDPAKDVLVRKDVVAVLCNPQGLAVNPKTNQALLGCNVGRAGSTGPPRRDGRLEPARAAAQALGHRSGGARRCRRRRRRKRRNGKGRVVAGVGLGASLAVNEIRMTATSAMALLIDRSMRRSSETAIRAGSVERVHHSYELDDRHCAISLIACLISARRHDDARLTCRAQGRLSRRRNVRSRRHGCRGSRGCRPDRADRATGYPRAGCWAV